MYKINNTKEILKRIKKNQPVVKGGVEDNKTIKRAQMWQW